MNLMSRAGCLMLGVMLFISSGCGVGYQKVNGKWSYVVWDEGNGRRALELKADQASFTKLGHKDYARDKDSVFYHTEPIPHADPTTFELLGDPIYSRDASHAYLMGHLIDGADPKTFAVLEAPYSKDADHVYCGTRRIEGADVARFKVLKGSSMWRQGDDLSTPITGFGWACDGTSHYYGLDQVTDADYESFRVIDETTAADKNRTFKGGFLGLNDPT